MKITRKYDILAYQELDRSNNTCVLQYQALKIEEKRERNRKAIIQKKPLRTSHSLIYLRQHCFYYYRQYLWILNILITQKIRKWTIPSLKIIKGKFIYNVGSPIFSLIPFSSYKCNIRRTIGWKIGNGDPLLP